MSLRKTRREVLQSLGVAGGVLTLGPHTVTASPAEDRWVCDTDADDMSASDLENNEDIEITEDLHDEIGYCIVECTENHLPADCDVDFSKEKFEEHYGEEDFDKENLDKLREKAENDEQLPYVPDVDLKLAGPEVAHDSGLNASNTVEDDLYDFQWDKKDQRIGHVHDTSTGDGARVGIIDSGVLGANPTRSVSHPDLPNVRDDLSENFGTGGPTPGPLGSQDHGTHVAGIAAAAENGTGVVGVAPDAEVVDLRVFPGASTSNIASAIVHGATPEDEGGAGCDAVNLSLGLGPLPVCSFIGLLILIFYYPLYESAGQYALDNDCLPVTSAGNSSTNHADPTAGGFCEPPLDFEIFGESGFFSLPASVDEFLTVSATGPIGYGWSDGGKGKGNGKGKGKNKSKEVGDTGFEIEHPIQTEQKATEPSFYTDYGGDDEVNVSAAGGNADLDLQETDTNYFYDFVFSSTFSFVPGDDGEDDEFLPSYGWKAGTSMAAPQVTGLAALLAAQDDDASASEIRDAIEETASQPPVGQSGSTTAPDTYPDLLGRAEGTNLATDGESDGDQPSNPGSNPETESVTTYRGFGHVDMKKAVKSFGDDD